MHNFLVLYVIISQKIGKIRDLKSFKHKKSGILRKWCKLSCLYSEFCEESVFQVMNFVKSLFFQYWILWRVRFSNAEFCEMSVNGLNFPLDPWLTKHAILISSPNLPHLKSCKSRIPWVSHRTLYSKLSALLQMPAL